MPDSFRHVGRGGAGNYRSQPSTTDPDKQPTKVSSTSNTTTTSIPSSPIPSHGHVSHPQPIRSGRGGAGNLLSSSTAAAAASSADREKFAERTEAAVRERLKTGGKFTAGRGGAGNLAPPNADADHRAAKQEAEETDRRVRLDKQAEEVVDLDLRPPQKIHERRSKGWHSSGSAGTEEV